MSDVHAGRRLLSLLVWLPLLAVHATAAALALWFLPRGFPLLHARCFTNELAPAALLATSLGLAILLVTRPKLARPALFSYPALWGGAAAAFALVFPLTSGPLLRLALLLAFCLSLASVPLFWRHSLSGRAGLIAAAAGALIGALWVRSLRAPDPTTRPNEPNARSLRLEPRDELVALPYSGFLRYDTADARFDARAGNLLLSLRPELTFISRSPERFWTVLAPGVQPGMAGFGASDAAALLEERRTRSARLIGPQTAVVEATTLLSHAVYSHLNSFLELSVDGHQRLALRFSPCPETPIELRYAGYPTGAPARFAYLDEGGAFRVVEATDAEKGPFALLAEGRLARGAPLGITLVELGSMPPHDRFRITLHDWSAQLSTALSPSAGYGVAENAVEFRLSAPVPSARAHVFVTLAGTGVGRGWDSVGHAPGVYRNRITLEALP